MYLLISIIICVLLLFTMFIANNLALATDVVRIDLKRSVSICVLATDVATKLI